jgi:hypothetical protein
MSAVLPSSDDFTNFFAKRKNAAVISRRSAKCADLFCGAENAAAGI